MITHEQQLPVDLLKALLSYSPETGELHWLAHPDKPKSRVAGLPAGKRSRSHQGRTEYFEIGIRLPGEHLTRLWVRAHRAAWALYHGQWPEGFIDHIDGNGLNNAICNLRLVTRSDNARNQPLHRTNTTGITGVVWHAQAKKWQAQGGTNDANGCRRTHYLGLHATLLDAAAARKSFELTNNFHPNHGRTPAERAAA